MVIDYLIEPERSHAFKKAMRQMRQQRLRDGAMRWGCSMIPLVRRVTSKRSRRIMGGDICASTSVVTVADHEAEEVSRAFHIGDQPPVVALFHCCKRLRRQDDQCALWG